MIKTTLVHKFYCDNYHHIPQQTQHTLLNVAERESLKIELLHYLLDNSWARIPDGMECNLCLRNELILDLISIKQQCEELQVPVTTTWNLKFQCWASGTAQLVLIVFNGQNVHYITTATYQHKLRESNFTNTTTCLTDSLEVDFKLSQIFVCIFSSLDNAVYKRKTTNYCLRVRTTSLSYYFFLSMSYTWNIPTKATKRLFIGGIHWQYTPNI